MLENLNREYIPMVSIHEDIIAGEDYYDEKWIYNLDDLLIMSDNSSKTHTFYF